MKGDEIPDEFFDDDILFDLYRSTIEKLYFGRQYLNKKFFQLLKNSSFREYIVLILAYRIEEKSLSVVNLADTGNKVSKISNSIPIDGTLLAGTFNVVKDDIFYGRYWGSFLNNRDDYHLDDKDPRSKKSSAKEKEEGMEEIPFLHFEACYYKAIEYCIDNNLKEMQPGAGGGDFKYIRGFDPYIVNSLHYISDSKLQTIIKNFLEEESKHMLKVEEVLLEQSSVRKKALPKQ